jgi:hypothetical protein
MADPGENIPGRSRHALSFPAHYSRVVPEKQGKSRGAAPGKFFEKRGLLFQDFRI